MDSNAKTYDSLKNVLYLPDRRNSQKLKSKLVGSLDEGQKGSMIDKEVECWTEWDVQNPDKSKGWNQVVVTCDSMRLRGR